MSERELVEDSGFLDLSIKSLITRKLQKIFNSENGRIAFSGHTDAAQVDLSDKEKQENKKNL